MKTLLNVFLAVAFLAFTSSCKNETEKDNTHTDMAEEVMPEQAGTNEPGVIERNDGFSDRGHDRPLGDNSRVSLDWPGTYQGVIPCADCPGIKVRITLDEDGTYTRSMSYQGKETQPVDDEGSFRWDAEGSSVILDTKDGEQWYQVGEEVLFHLDEEGNRIKGKMETDYELEKFYRDDQLEDHKWVLVELMKKPVDADAGMKEGYLMFNSEEGIMTGNNTCNGLRSSYVIKRSRGLSLGLIASTRMACPDMAMADKFDEVLGQVNRYEIHQDTLSLDHTHMAPLARFVRAD